MEMIGTSYAVDRDERKDAFTAVVFVALESIILSLCCTGIGSRTAQPPFLSGRKPGRMGHMKEKFTKKISSLDGVQILKMEICTVISHRIMSNGSVSGIRTIAFIIFPSSQRNLHCHSYLQLVLCLFC